MERKTEEQIHCEEIAKECQEIQRKCRDHTREMIGTHCFDSLFALFPLALEEAALGHLYQDDLAEEVFKTCRGAFKKRRERLVIEIALTGGFLRPGYSIQELERVVSGIENFYSEQVLPLVALTYKKHDNRHQFSMASSRNA